MQEGLDGDHEGREGGQHEEEQGCFYCSREITWVTLPAFLWRLIRLSFIFFTLAFLLVRFAFVVFHTSKLSNVLATNATCASLPTVNKYLNETTSLNENVVMYMGWLNNGGKLGTGLCDLLGGSQGYARIVQEACLISVMCKTHDVKSSYQG